MKRLSLALLITPFCLLSALAADESLIFEDGKAEPLAQGLEFHHGSWKFSDGAMIGEQVPTEKHTATIKGLMAFDQMKIEWKMKFVVPKQNFLFVTWPAESRGHAMDFTFLPDNGEFAIVRPGSADQKSAVLAKGKLPELAKNWHEVACIHDGPTFTVTIDGVSITAADASFNRPMGPFYLNGGGFDGAKYLVKDLKVTALPGSPQKRAFLSAEPPKAAAALTQAEATHAAYKPSPDDILIADFEGEDNGGWKAEGEAFGPGPRVNRITGFLGKKLINSYLKGDTTTGTLTSQPFKIERKHINFLIGGGNHPGKVGMQLMMDGKVVRSATGPAMKNAANQEIMDWHSWDMSEFAGKTVTLQIIDQVTGGWGHTLIDHIFQSNNAMPSSLPSMAARKAGTKPGPEADAYALVEQSQTWNTFPLYAKVGYDQPLRPQFHFTSRVGWLNDPNGMVYYDGEWLMAFQHFAKGNASGAKSWGQAVSKDLMHWTQLPHALNPYPNVKWAHGNDHAIWSGSAIVDQFNTLGKQQDEVKTIFAMFTATHAGEDKRGAFFQVGAYSNDKGRTWTKINDGKPLIDHLEGFDPGQRDPYLFYHAPTKSYRFIMEIGGPEHAVRIWKSSDLMKWEAVCDIPNKSAECINMYSVPVDGDPMNVKWVIANAGTGYEVGDFDGTKWAGLGDKDKDGRPLKFEYGDCYYAAQTFNQAPDHRVVHVGWLRTGSLLTDAGMPFTQQLSVPAEITLRTTPDGIRMFRNPVKEIATLYARTDTFDNLTAEAANAKLAALKPELIDMSLTFAPAGKFTLSVRGLKIDYDAAKKEFAVINEARVEAEKAAMLKRPADRQQSYRDIPRRAVPAPEVDGKVRLRVLVDRASLELFINEGQAAASFVMVADPKNREISLMGGGALKFSSLEVNELKSAWTGE